MIPATAPTAKSSRTPSRNSLTACKMYWYFPSSSRMKAPEIPGRIIAQMATAPESMINHQSLGVCVGEAIVIQNASAVPTSSPSSEVRFHFRISRATKAAEATISPKKKDQISIG